MSQSQYLKMLEKEIQNINKIIDHKIMRGEEYTKEARDHKLMLKKVRYHSRSRGNIFQRLFSTQTFQF